MNNNRLLHKCSIKLKWSDMDAQGHINNLEYIRYMEECRVQWLQQLVMDKQEYIPVVVSVQAEYLQELVYPGEVTVLMYGSSVGRSSFMTHYEVVRGEDEQLVSRGNAKIVVLSASDHRPVSVPNELRALLEFSDNAQQVVM